MAMIDMACSAEEQAEGSLMGGASSPYPYGLCINLDEESLGKLGFSGPPVPGTVISFQCIAKVTSSSQSQGMDSDGPGEVESNSGWQITAMEVMGSGTDAAKSLFDC